MRFLRHVHGQIRRCLGGIRGDLFGIVGNKILLHPSRALRLHAKVEKLFFRAGDKRISFGCRWLAPWRGGFCVRLRRFVRAAWGHRQQPEYHDPCRGKAHHAERIFIGHHALADSVFATTSRNTSMARSIPARSTSQCVTKRTECKAVSCARTPCAASASHSSTAVLPVCEQSKIKIFVRTLAASMRNPGVLATALANSCAFSWSICKRAGDFSRAISPAAASTPAWRIPPPSILRYTRACSMNSREPAIMLPTGAPKPVDKQI